MQLKKFILLSYLFCIILTHSFCGSAPRQELVLATYAYADNNRLANLEPLAAYLQEETGFKVTAASYPSVQALTAAIVEGKVDLAMINTLGYLSFQRKHAGIAMPLVTLDAGDAKATNYAGCILASTSSRITSLQDAVVDDTVFTFALVNKASTSGNLVPRLILNSFGIANAEKQFKTYYAGTHKQVIDDLLAGKAAVGGCGCHEYYKQVESDESFEDKVIDIASYNNIPLGPIIFKNTLDTQTVAKIEAALLRIHEQDVKAFQTFKAGWTEFLEARKFKPAKDEDYNQFRNLFGQNEQLWKLLD